MFRKRMTRGQVMVVARLTQDQHLVGPVDPAGSTTRDASLVSFYIYIYVTRFEKKHKNTKAED